MSAHKDQINLIPRRGFESTTTGRVITWLLGTFRIILIITELIVMIAFFSRFFLDSKNSELNEDINQKKSIIQSFANTENNFISVQNKLNLFTILTKDKDKHINILDSIRTSLPENIEELSLTDINIQNDSINLSGISISERAIQQFIVNLETSSSIKNVGLQDVTNKRNDAFMNFSLSMIFESKEGDIKI